MTWVQTEDGSWTCLEPKLGEHYHNRHGAWHEACALYVTASQLAERLKTTPHLWVLDPFLGLGYNTLGLMAAFHELQQTRFPHAMLTVVAVEHDRDILAKIPLAIQKNEYDSLNEFLPLFAHNTYYQTHSDLLTFIERRKKASQDPIALGLYTGDTRKALLALPDAQFDLIYHDAFSPRTQPELWTKRLFGEYHRILKPDLGWVITYSAAAAIRSGLAETGFLLEAWPYDDHKTGTLAMLRTPVAPLGQPLTEKERALMASKTGLPYDDDPTLSTPPEIIRQNRLRQQQSAGSLPTSSAVHRQFAMDRGSATR